MATAAAAGTPGGAVPAAPGAATVTAAVGGGISAGAAGNKELREIGHEAVWSLSTAKPGNGVEQIRDDNADTYWQSDGAQPHLINVQFHKKMTVLEVGLYLDYSLDESYTPKRIAIKAGTTCHDLVEIQLVELHEPQGWVRIPLRNPHLEPGGFGSGGGGGGEGGGGLLRAHLLQICILAMHQNGRDTHVRQAKVYGPRLSLAPMAAYARDPGQGGGGAAATAGEGEAGGQQQQQAKASYTVPEFTSVEFAQFSTVR